MHANGSAFDRNLGRLICQAAFRHDLEANRMVLACYQYRLEFDMAWLKGTDLPIGRGG